MSQHQHPPNEGIATEDTDTEPSTETAGVTDQRKDSRYRCPICEAIYDNEITARVHITRSDDEEHEHHNGLMPEAEVEVLSRDGEVIDTVSRQPEEIAVESLSVDQLPDDYPEHHRRIIKIATHHPYKSYSELEELVGSEFSELDLEVPSYSTIHRVVRDFFHPQAERSTEKTESLDELTAKQQAIIIARALLPDQTKSHIADRVGCASSYPAQVFDRAPNIVQRFGQNGDDETSEMLKSELTPESIDELTSRGLVEDLPIEFDSTATTTEEVEATDDDGDSGQQSLWGSPVDNQTGLRGVPEPDVSTVSDDKEQTDPTQEQDAEESNADMTDTLPDDDPIHDIADLYREVSFLVDIFEHVDLEHNTELTEAVIKTVAGRCESILQTRGEAQ